MPRRKIRCSPTMALSEEVFMHLLPKDLARVFDDVVNNVGDIPDLIAQFEAERDQLNEKLAADGRTTVESTNELKKLIHEYKVLIKKIEAFKDGIIRFQKDRKKAQTFFGRIHALVSGTQYVKVVNEIEQLSLSLEKAFLSKHDERCVTLFANLCEVGRVVYEGEAMHMRMYMTGMILFWHEALKRQFDSSFDDVLVMIKWPFVGANALSNPLPAQLSKLQLVTEYLLQIEVPEEHYKLAVKSGPAPDFPRPCLPVLFLLRPFCRRFSYHFHGNKQTNRIDKPEWYFSLVLAWIRDHVDFIDKWIQPVAAKLGLHHIDMKLELMRGLVQLAVEKLRCELPSQRNDDFTFSHSVDEALGFDKELRETFEYTAREPSVLNVLTQASIFKYWIKMERKYALEKMDKMLNNLDMAFGLLTAEEDEHKTTVCADTFVTLLQTITARYHALPQPGHRLQFLALQIDLLDNFRIRLLQLVKSAGEQKDVMESKIASIANTAFYIENVLMDWGHTLHYLTLYHYKTHGDEVAEANELAASQVKSNEHGCDCANPAVETESETAFTNSLALFQHMRRELLNKLTEAVMHEAKLKAYDYMRDQWSNFPRRKRMRECSLTPSASPMFEVLARRLHQLQKALAGQLFTLVWRSLAHGLDGYFFKTLVLSNRFNDGGAMQLKYDVHRNLLPLFAQFSEKPHSYFMQTKESCDLLNISVGTAYLLRDTLVALQGALGAEERRTKALKDVGVRNLTAQMSLQILNRRTDFAANRVSSID